MKRTFFIAGVQFRPKNEIAEAGKILKQGDLLRLIPEPTNKFDSNAVMITLPIEEEQKELFLGYVPKKFSSEVAGMLSIGAPIGCIVEVVNPAAKTYEMFKVTVQIPEDEEYEEPDMIEEGDK